MGVQIWILFVIALLIIIISFMMSPQSNSFSGALVGSADLELFNVNKDRGIRVFLKRAMYTLGILLMIVAVILRLYV